VNDGGEYVSLIDVTNDEQRNSGPDIFQHFMFLRHLAQRAPRLAWRCLSVEATNATKPYYITTPIFYPNAGQIIVPNSLIF
jgi:hypothetical protein